MVGLFVASLWSDTLTVHCAGHWRCWFILGDHSEGSSASLQVEETKSIVTCALRWYLSMLHRKLQIFWVSLTPLESIGSPHAETKQRFIELESLQGEFPIRSAQFQGSFSVILSVPCSKIYPLMLFVFVFLLLNICLSFVYFFFLVSPSPHSTIPPSLTCFNQSGFKQFCAGP